MKGGRESESLGFYCSPTNRPGTSAGGNRALRSPWHSAARCSPRECREQRSPRGKQMMTHRAHRGARKSAGFNLEEWTGMEEEGRFALHSWTQDGRLKRFQKVRRLQLRGMDRRGRGGRVCSAFLEPGRTSTTIPAPFEWLLNHHANCTQLICVHCVGSGTTMHCLPTLILSVVCWSY